MKFRFLLPDITFEVFIKFLSSLSMNFLKMFLQDRTSGILDSGYDN